jgi:hypothetical protein
LSTSKSHKPISIQPPRKHQKPQNSNRGLYEIANTRLLTAEKQRKNLYSNRGLYEIANTRLLTAEKQRKNLYRNIKKSYSKPIRFSFQITSKFLFTWKPQEPKKFSHSSMASLREFIPKKFSTHQPEIKTWESTYPKIESPLFGLRENARKNPIFSDAGAVRDPLTSTSSSTAADPPETSHSPSPDLSISLYGPNFDDPPKSEDGRRQRDGSEDGRREWKKKKIVTKFNRE